MRVFASQEAAQVYKDMKAVQAAETMFVKKTVSAELIGAIDPSEKSELHVNNPFNQSGKQDPALLYDSNVAFKRNTEEGLFSRTDEEFKSARNNNRSHSQLAITTHKSMV